ncbi:MAG TPA: hypothetical protein DF712_03010, partial [Balneola sp.]|nr:hypothetical protein [Balneola sp.]
MKNQILNLQGFPKIELHGWGVDNFRKQGSINLSPFVTSCSWASGVNPPYGNANITLKMHAQMVHMVFNGRPLKDNKHVRHIEAGGWITIRNPNTSRVLFLGQILEISVQTTRTETGILSCDINLTVMTFIYPLTVSAIVKTPSKVGELTEVVNAAISEFDEHSSFVSDLIKISHSLKNQEHVSYKLLAKFIEKFGHFEMPFIGKQQQIHFRDIVSVLEPDDDPTRNLLLKENLIEGRPKHEYVKQTLLARYFTMWNLITEIFQPDPNIIELFPMLLPVKKSEDLREEEEFLEEFGVNFKVPAQSFAQSFLDNLKVMPRIIYRYRPIDPSHPIKKETVDDRYNIKSPDSASEEFYGY